MDPFSSERRVIEAAEALARTLGDDPNHTVAAVALDSRGRIHTAVNVYHFTGGPVLSLSSLVSPRLRRRVLSSLWPQPATERAD